LGVSKSEQPVDNQVTTVHYLNSWRKFRVTRETLFGDLLKQATTRFALVDSDGFSLVDCDEAEFMTNSTVWGNDGIVLKSSKLSESEIK